jgi:hypothetical protein
MRTVAVLGGKDPGEGAGDRSGGTSFNERVMS